MIVARALCVVCCAMSIGALLGKLHGLIEMSTAGLFAEVPACVLLTLIWIWSGRARERAELHEILNIGLLGGVAGTIFYDIARAPFHLLGQRIFAPISAFGVWLLDAHASSRITEATGWAYHFSNGLTLAVIYALFMRGRHWAWAIVWACLLETLAIISPFGRVFALRGNPSGIAIAYLGHVAYGIPLGLMVQHSASVWRGLSQIPRAAYIVSIALGLIALSAPLMSTEQAERDARRTPGEFRVEGKTLNPDWLRIKKQDSITIRNPGAQAVVIRVPKWQREWTLAPGDFTTIEFLRTGIFQVHVADPVRTRSSFVIVEPVESE